ncbi:MAG: 4-(cytidine 5'-diphospho)-2-C-methyl-D-erythritol kinase [Sedimentitalea sp.]
MGRSAPITGVQVFAPAKINLTLHITGQRDDGYHLLDSLVVFADVGDELLVQVGSTISVTTEGPEAALVPADMSNLVLRVAALFKDLPGASFLLTKNLPVASGIGGGSADAAAAFRGMMCHHSGGETDPMMYDPAKTPMSRSLLDLGADIPVCLQSRPARMAGIGDVLSPVPDMEVLHAVLVNPRVGVPTPSVFRALKSKTNPAMPEIPQFHGRNHLIDWLGAQRNDLEPPAIELQPEIKRVKRALEAFPTCLLARMSGSGATCFGVFESHDAAQNAQRGLSKQYPDWWVQAACLGDQSHRARLRPY